MLFGEIAVGKASLAEKLFPLVNFGGFFTIDFDDLLKDLIGLEFEVKVGRILLMIRGGLFFVDVAFDFHMFENGTLI